MKKLIIILALLLMGHPASVPGPSLPGRVKIYNVAGVAVQDTSAPGLYYLIKDSSIHLLKVR